jgi:hypothetical protein
VTTPQDKLTVALCSTGDPTDATLVHLMRFAQWALDEAAHGLLAGKVSDARLAELGDGLELVAWRIKERARRGA